MSALGTATPTRKVCGRCKQRRRLSQFAHASDQRDGRQTWCRPCNTEIVLGRRRTAPDAYRAYDRAWRRARSALRHAHGRSYKRLERREMERQARIARGKARLSRRAEWEFWCKACRNAKYRATSRLVRQYPEEFRRLLIAEVAAEGLPTATVGLPR